MDIVAGGLGGGGDVGLATIVIEGYRAWSRVEAIASFRGCRAGSRRFRGNLVRGSLVKLRGEIRGKRVFEDKLARAGLWSGDTYIICTRNAWNDIVDGLSWLIKEHNPKCMLMADIGGDGILLGYEESLGSYVTDTVAKAALAWASREHGVRGIIAAGGIGAEGGGSGIHLPNLYATLKYLDNIGAILGAWVPEPVHTIPAKKLLQHAESGMLPLYIAAVEGKRWVEIRQAYLNGVYEVKPWYKYVAFIDAAILCEASPLCKAAQERGRSDILEWKRPDPPPQDYIILLREAKRLDVEGRLDKAFTTLFSRIASNNQGTYELCSHYVNYITNTQQHA